MTEPKWILRDVALAVHRRQIAEHGGLDGVRDEGLFESALAKPQNLYHYNDPRPTLAEIAAAYAYGIARNHAFLDGNKRTALVICRLFLALNGVEFKASSSEKYQTFMKLASGDLTEEALAKWIADHS
jgi:death-on-curing protein